MAEQQGKTTRKRDSLKRFLRCEPLEDRRLLAAIFGYKFEDLNRNGMDDGEPRLPGVQIRVSYVDSNSNQVTRTSATGADGEYQFQDLPAATMTVTEVPPPGLEQTTADPTPFFLSATENAVAFAGQSGSDMETVIPNLAFGNAVALGSIQGYKFEDLNGNGVNDDEPRLADVEINLEYSIGNNGFVITTLTDAAGEYNFEDLPATTMTVTEVPPTGFVPTTAATTSFALGVGENAVAIAGQSGMENETVITELAFGNTVLGSIHGLKFEDINGNGIYEPNLGDLPQADVEFTLTGIDGRGQMIEATMVTDSSGAFWFEDLWPSVDGSPTDGANATGYTVTEIVPDGFAATGLASRTFDLLSRQELVWSSGAANLPTDDPRIEVVVGETLMFGNTVLGSIHGFKFEDANGNGLYEPGFDESGLPGVIFTLTGIDGLNRPVNRTTTTGIDGEFEFVGLQPSNSDGYLVSEVVPTGFLPTTPTSRTFNLSSRQEYVWQFGAADLGEGDPRVEVLATMDEASNLGEELIFGNVIPGSIHGFKFLDIDGDGIFDEETEAGLADIPFQLTGVDGSGATIDITVMSGADGEYDFVGLLPSIEGQPTAVPDLLQTGYTVTELTPADFPATTPTTFFTNVRSGEEYVAFAGQSTPVFGPQLDQAQPFANTELPGDETAYPAQTFVPTVSGPLAAVSIEFSSLAVVLPVSDILVEIQTTNTITGLPTGTVLASAAISTSAGLVGGQTRIDFATPPMLLAGDSYAIVVRSESNTTSFALAASDLNPYANGTALSTPNNGVNWSIVPGNDLVFATFMTQRINVEEVVGDALIVGNTIYGSLHGFKYEDINGNGIYEPMIDTPLSGVTFQLEGTLADGTEIARQAVTDSDGEFDFTDLPPSVAGNEQATGYFLVELIPTGFVPTTSVESFFDLLAGEEIVYAAGASDVDPQDPNDPRTEVVDQQGRLIFGNTVLGSIHGFKFEDINGNGIYEPNLGDLPQADVEFTLTGIDGRGQMIEATMVTDSSGAFWFEELWPSVDGSPTDGANATGYTVTEIVPDGFTSTTPSIRTFDLLSRQELVWSSGAANLPTDDPRIEVVVGETLMFGNTVLGSIHGFKFEDVNGNGLYEPGFDESGLPGVIFTLTGIDGLNRPVNLTTTTGIDGEFEFVGLQPSNSDGYLVSEVVPTGFLPTTPTSQTFNLSSRQEYVWQFGAADLGEGDPRVEVLATMDEASNLGEELIFGNVIPGSIHGFKFLDIDGDGVFDEETEAGLADIPFQLTGVDGSGATIDITVMSGADGEYDFVGLLPSIEGQPTGRPRSASNRLHRDRVDARRFPSNHADHILYQCPFRRGIRSVCGAIDAGLWPSTGPSPTLRQYRVTG